MKRADLAAQNIASGKMNCAQSVLTAFCEEYGLERALARRIALGFGGGMGRTGRTCGAVTGAYMVLGLRHNLTAESAEKVKEEVYWEIQEFDREFNARHRSTACKELLGYDLNTPAGFAAARDKHLFTTLCPQLVKDAVEILEAMGPA